MSGIQALAAAAAQTQRLPTPTSSATGVRMVQPTLLTSQGVRVTPVPGSVSGAQTVRLSSGATILKAGTTLQGLQVKKGIVTSNKFTICIYICIFSLRPSRQPVANKLFYKNQAQLVSEVSLK
jgi:hypothetical protein